MLLKRLVSAAALMFAALACSEQAVAPNSPSQAAGLKVSLGSVTLAVTNTTGASYRLQASPNMSPPIPQPSGGIVGIGIAAPGSSCFSLPSSVQVLATNVASGQVDTVKWADSAPMSLSASAGTAMLSSSNFVPGGNSGWGVTISGEGSLVLSPAAPCRP